jgi:two-component system cell cycle sensor histidine kinase/response regulator CckA
VRHVMRDVAGMLDATLFKDVTVHTNAARNLPMVVADPTQLHQVLLNLAVNAAQAMRGRGDLWITAELVALTGDEAERIPGGRPGSYVCLAVADTGSGIAPAVLERIFEPFFTTKGPGEGTGLGLSTSLGIVRDHGGFIGVETARDTGTMFRVYLPPAPDDVTAADDGGRASAELAGGGELVLVVDDEDALLSLIVETLATYGYRTIRAANGAEGIAAFASNASEVAVVLTDVKMPVMDGIAMLKVIHQIKPGVRVVAMSGVDTSLDDAGRMVAEGVTCVLQKPFDAAQLARALREALEAQEPTP